MKKSFLVLILITIFSVFAESSYINNENIFFIPSDININTLLPEIISKNKFEFEYYDKKNYGCTWRFSGDKYVQIEDKKQISCKELVFFTEDYTNKVTSIRFNLYINDNDAMEIINSINNSFEKSPKLITFDNDMLSYSFEPTERLRGFLNYNVYEKSKEIVVTVFFN